MSPKTPRGVRRELGDVSHELGEALGAAIGRAIRRSVSRWRAEAGPELARRVRDRLRSGARPAADPGLDPLLRELEALRRELGGRMTSVQADPRELAERIAGAVAARLRRDVGSVPPPPPRGKAQPEEPRPRIPLDDITGIVDRLIQERY